MALQHDNQGFLTGSQIDLGVIADLFKKVAADVKTIKTALLHGQQSTPQQTAKPDSRPAQPQTVIAMPRQRDEQGRFKSVKQQAVEPKRKIEARTGQTGTTDTVQREIKLPSQQPQPVATPRAISQRDDKGRFLAGDSDKQGDAALTKMASRFAVAVKDAVSANGDVDPSVTAARELKATVEPLGRGFSTLFSGKSETKHDRLLSKILKSIDVLHRDSSLFNKKQKKLLEELRDKPTGGSWSVSSSESSTGGGIGGFLKGLIGGGLLSKLLKGGKGFLRKIPIIGALLAGGGAAVDVWGSESDETLSRREKDSAIGQSIGGWTGSLGGVIGGAALGSAFGPVGTVIGAIVGGFGGDQLGQIVGKQFGEWVNDLRDYDVAGKVVESWRNMVSGVSELAKQAFDKLATVFDKVANIGGLIVDAAKEQLNDANNYIKANTEIDVKDMAEKWWERTSGNISDAWDAVKSGSEWLMSNSTIGKTTKAVRNLKTGGEIGSAEEAMQFFIGRGYKAEHAAAIAANLKAESEFDTSAKGDGGKAVGIAQWHKPRQEQFEKLYGKKLEKATFQEQLAFVDWELQNTHKYAANRIFATDNPADAAKMVEKHYEGTKLSSQGGFQFERIQNAIKFATPVIASAKAPNVPAPIAPPSVSAAPEIREPLNSKSDRPIIAHVPVADVGRDLTDRSIAHVATGGLNGR